MNYEINSEKFNTEILLNKTDVKPFLLLILSVIFIPAAYMFVAAVFIVQAIKKNISITEKNTIIKLIFFYILIGILFSQYKLISSIYGIMMVLCLYSFYLLSTSLNPSDLRKIVKLTYIVSIVVFIIGISQYFSPEFTMPGKWVDADKYQLSRRVYSTFFNPNILGFYINFIILIVCTNLDLKKINLEWFVFLTGILCLFFTFSRTSWISLIIAFLIGSIFNKKYLKFAIIISLAIFGMDIILGIGRMDPGRAAEDSSLMYRLEIWKACIEIIKDNFITGIGFGTLFKHISQYSNVVKPNIEHCHNLYLQIFTETGIIGLSISLSMFYKMIKKLWNKIHSQNNAIWITALTVLAMTMIHGMVDSVFFTPQILMILSIYAGTLSIADK
ncbi:MAG: O-antigen ligase family protein [Sedimentibacter sp.]|uniref:O-antigen ligase family protein n=1 Tax=Sedimentibacter sp. TaxID=1960295 RepID=UPI002981AEC2|nr:O-antigen ligase family protein [Sedimentibacter sp.]MDW5300250.1 O-antigen ligase family protein [Sedimentibacter sp.]